MRQIDYRDLIAGLIMVGLGFLVAQYAGAHYQVGDPASMGPGFFPVTLGWVLVVLGAVIALLSFRNAAQALTPPHLAPRALIAVPAAILAFSLLVNSTGLVPATVVLTFIAVAAERPYRLRRTAVLSVVLALVAWLIFTVGLGMNLPAFAFSG